MGMLGDQLYWELTYDESGVLLSPDQPGLVDEVVDAVDDLFVLSHGWNTPTQHAHELYGALIPLIADAAEGRALGRIGFCGLVWPAVWFPDTPADGQEGGESGAAQSVDDAKSTADALPDLSGAEIAQTLVSLYPDGDERRAIVLDLGSLIDEGLAAAGAGNEPDHVQRKRLERFTNLLQVLVAAEESTAVEDSGELALLRSAAAEDDYRLAAATFGDASASGAQSGGDLFSQVWAGGKVGLRVFSFWTMKARAGVVGKHGLGPLLMALHRRDHRTRVHLVGHSFGARLGSYALSGIERATDSPVASLTLVQGAFSHFTFSHRKDNPFDKAGELETFADRVRGPLVSTFSVNDRAVGIWYPKASFLSRQDASSAGTPRWAGMGADGFQAVAPFGEREMSGSGTDYRFTAGTFYRVDAQKFICTIQDQFSGAHSDIRRPEIAWLVVAAALT